MEIKNEIKSYITRKGKTLTEVVNLLNSKHQANEDNKPQTVANLSNKLTRGTIKYIEVKEIADILGCEIKWIDK